MPDQVLEYLQLVFDDCKYLYRRIRTSFDDLKEDCKQGNRAYWPSFSSTSLEYQEALQFSTTNKVVFRIKLSSDFNKIHLCVKMWDFPEFPSEKEILLFPFFAYIVEEVREEDRVKIIDLKQDDEIQLLA